MPADCPEPLFTVTELATAWRVSKNHIYRLVNAGILAAVDIGEGRAKTRVPQSAVTSYLTKRRIRARRTATVTHLRVA